jgi:hypothetical protein
MFYSRSFYVVLCVVYSSGGKLHVSDTSVYTRHNNNNRCEIIPVIIGSTGIVTKGLRKNLEAIPGKH